MHHRLILDLHFLALHRYLRLLGLTLTRVK